MLLGYSAVQVDDSKHRLHIPACCRVGTDAVTLQERTPSVLKLHRKPQHQAKIPINFLSFGSIYPALLTEWRFGKLIAEYLASPVNQNHIAHLFRDLFWVFFNRAGQVSTSRPKRALTSQKPRAQKQNGRRFIAGKRGVCGNGDRKKKTEWRLLEFRLARLYVQTQPASEGSAEGHLCPYDSKETPAVRLET